MYCKHCGTENDSAFCTNCGARMEAPPAPGKKSASEPKEPRYEFFDPPKTGAAKPVAGAPPGSPVNKEQAQSAHPRPASDPDKLGFVLSLVCLIWPVGLILFFSWRQERPAAAKTALVMAALGIFLTVGMAIGDQLIERFDVWGFADMV